VQLSGVPTQNSGVPVVLRPSPAFIEQALLDEGNARQAAPPGEAVVLQVSYAPCCDVHEPGVIANVVVCPSDTHMIDVAPLRHAR